MGRIHNIEGKKNKMDSLRSTAFTKHARNITVAARQGGGDPAYNAALKLAIDKAKADNMPNDNIQRCIKKAAGETGGDNYEEIVYEGYGPSGVAVIVETLTDNRNRTAADMRHYFDKCGGNLGQTGCVTFMFDKKGIIIVNGEGADEDQLMMDALDAGADDFSAEDDGYFEVSTDPDVFGAVCAALEEKGYKIESAEVLRVPQTTVTLTSEDDLKNMTKLIDMLDDNDDVQNVFHNCDIPDEE